MSKWTSGKEEFEAGFESVQPGEYVFQVEDGITLRDSQQDDSLAKTFMFQFNALEARDDANQDSVGRKISLFINIIKKDGESLNEYGERQIINLLTCLKVSKYFASKFDDNTNIYDDAVVLEMNKMLPGRKVRGTVKMGKDQSGNDRPELTSSKPFEGQAELGGGGASNSEAKDSSDFDDKEWSGE